MNSIEKHLYEIAGGLYSKFQETKKEVDILLQKYSANFPEYTDHSASHTLAVFEIASEIMTDDEVNNLGVDETYILAMACLLHDIGMCIPEGKINEIKDSNEILLYKKSHPNLSVSEYIRDIHHKLSNKFILEEWELLKIPSKKYAYAIGLVAEGHRKVDLGNFDIYEAQYFAKSGKEFVCLPYLACILRIADELDVTNSRTPRLLTKYYMPNNEVSIREWSKHIATSQRNYKDNLVIFEVDCTDHNIYAALQEQFDKIQNVINSCQKVIRSIPAVKTNPYELNITLIEVKYNFIEFNPKGIRFSLDVPNVITAFIGEDLYKDNLTSLREAIQNSIDSCRYKAAVLKESFDPFIRVSVTDKVIKVEDNGAGMDDFIIENFFAKLASSFYEQDKIKDQFEAIGQFGVGVFSYFLLSEYIDIETKMASSNTIKFRFDKDPKSYFHFYKNFERSVAGTTITMYLKNQYVSKLENNVIENYIRRIFRHIEFPIEINILNSKTILESLPFEADCKVEIKKRLDLRHRKLYEFLTFITVHVDDEEVNGSASMIIGKKNTETFKYQSEYFDSDTFHSTGDYHANLSEISVSQKGVYVCSYGSPSLALMLGSVNLKKKVKINIDRNDFSNDVDVLKQLQKFELKIINDLFLRLQSELGDRENSELYYELTNDFLRNYFSSYHINDKPGFRKAFNEFLYVKMFINNEIVIAKIKELENHQKFALVFGEDDYLGMYRALNMPIIIGSDKDTYSDMRRLEYLFRNIFQYGTECVHLNSRGILVFDTQNQLINQEVDKILEDIFDYRILKPIDSKSNKLLVSYVIDDLNLKNYITSDMFCINLNHWFTKLLADKYYTEIILEPDGRKIVKAVFFLITQFTNTLEMKDDIIKNINEVFSGLKHIENYREFKLGELF